MPLVVADRVRETTTTTGTGTITLAGAVTGYQSFSVVGNANTTYYTINADNQWEVGIGTYLSAGPTLSRDTVLKSSNSGSLVDFAAGTKDVFLTYPAEKSVYQDGAAIAAGSAVLPIANGGTNATTAANALTSLGAYPAANPSGFTSNTGTVTSVSGTGTVSGLTLTGSITTSGSLTLGGTLALTSGEVTTALGFTPYSDANPSGFTSNTGTVTSVGGTGTVNGLTLTGTVTTSGSLTLGGTLSNVSLATQVTGTLPVANGGTGATTLTANNVLLGNGTSALQTVAPGTSGNILTSNGTTWTSATPAAGGSTLTAVASGSLSDGSTVVINADGTVSVVVGTTQAVGTPVVFNSAQTGAASGTISAAYDAASQRVVIAYRNGGNSSRGTAVVGTVSGTSITFGTPVVFNSASTSSISATYDANSARVVIAYTNWGNNYYGTAIVGTVSGTSISFGTAVVFESATAEAMSATYDTTAQRVVIAYYDAGNSNFGTAIVGTVSGTSISFGSAVVFNSAGTYNLNVTYDTAQARVVIAYANSGNSTRGTAIVGTVSGTSISFGTAVVFETATTQWVSATYDASTQRVVVAYQDNTTTFGNAVVGTVSGTSISFGTRVTFQSSYVQFIAATYNTAAQRVVIAFQDVGNSSFGTFRVGTVSGTSISFGSAVVFQTANINDTFAIYDASTQRVVIAYSNQGNSGFGTTAVIRNESTNITTENFIGISNAAYTNGQTATIQIIGSVDDAQSGLTAGQSYFVQNDGTLGLTPATPSVFAGTAVSATKIIVKG
jgi:hypothetical protein